MVFDQKKAEKHLNKLLKKHKIKVVKWSKSACGMAWPFHKEVKIPKPTNELNFCTAMHEIKHVIDGIHIIDDYLEEYYCEMYAVGQAKMLGFDASEYQILAMRYVVDVIAKSHNKGLIDVMKINIDIKKDIKKYCKINFKEWKKWKNKKVKISGITHLSDEFKIHYYEP